MNKKYIVRLSDEERGVCQQIIKKLQGASQKFRRAQILLKADADGPGWSDVKIAEAFNCRVQTIEHVRVDPEQAAQHFVVVLTEGWRAVAVGRRRAERVPHGPPRIPAPAAD